MCKCGSPDCRKAATIRPIGGFDLLGGFVANAAATLDNAAYIAFRDDPTEAAFCAIRDAIPPSMRDAFVEAHKPPFSLIERSANVAVVGLAPTYLAMAVPPLLPFAGMLSVPATLFAEAGRFGRSMVAHCGFFNALRQEARDVLALLDFWTNSHPVGGKARLALTAVGGGQANMIVDRARAPLKRLLQPLADGRAPRVADALGALSALLSLAGEFADLEGFDGDVANAESRYCELVGGTDAACGKTPTSKIRPISAGNLTIRSPAKKAPPPPTAVNDDGGFAGMVLKGLLIGAAVKAAT